MPVEFPNPVEFISAVNINPHDLIDYGRYILPLVRQELAQREASGQRCSLQHDYPGASATTAPLPERTSA